MRRREHPGSHRGGVARRWFDPGRPPVPTDEREARFFLLPPDRVATTPKQTEGIRFAKIGGAGWRDRAHRRRRRTQLTAASTRGRRYGKRSETRGDLPFGPVTSLKFDTAFSVLEVDQMVERFEGSAAPIYPSELLASGTEGMVQATYVVDTAGRVDTATIKVKLSDDPRFTESVRVALSVRFRPAKRAGKTVRQLVEQRFRFQITPPSQALDRQLGPVLTLETATEPRRLGSIPTRRGRHAAPDHGHAVHDRACGRAHAQPRSPVTGRHPRHRAGRRRVIDAARLKPFTLLRQLTLTRGTRSSRSAGSRSSSPAPRSAAGRCCWMC